MTRAEAFPEGTAWRCRSGHAYPEDFEPIVCPVDGLTLTRVVMAIIHDDDEEAEALDAT